MNNFTEKLAAFAALVQKHGLLNLIKDNVDCEANRLSCATEMHLGKKYARVDKRGCGRYMVDMTTGEIFGIKAYGQVHKGRAYGTLDTVNDYYWGNYYAMPLDCARRIGALPAALMANKEAI